MPCFAKVTFSFTTKLYEVNSIYLQGCLNTVINLTLVLIKIRAQARSKSKKQKFLKSSDHHSYYSYCYCNFHSHFFLDISVQGERCMRLSLCEAPTHQKTQHKGQPQHRELRTLLLFSISVPH